MISIKSLAIILCFALGAAASWQLLSVDLSAHQELAAYFIAFSCLPLGLYMLDAKAISTILCVSLGAFSSWQLLTPDLSAQQEFIAFITAFICVPLGLFMTHDLFAKKPLMQDKDVCSIDAGDGATDEARERHITPDRNGKTYQYFTLITDGEFQGMYRCVPMFGLSTYGNTALEREMADIYASGFKVFVIDPKASM